MYLSQEQGFSSSLVVLVPHRGVMLGTGLRCLHWQVVPLDSTIIGALWFVRVQQGKLDS
jgi:hypothetical protein